MFGGMASFLAAIWVKRVVFPILIKTNNNTNVINNQVYLIKQSRVMFYSLVTKFRVKLYFNHK